ncbi:MAG: hypothetical protein ACHQQQ_08790, partial [Bacteroidota bacterium]
VKKTISIIRKLRYIYDRRGKFDQMSSIRPRFVKGIFMYLLFFSIDTLGECCSAVMVHESVREPCFVVADHRIGGYFESDWAFTRVW